uniref:Pentatricopeptide repeat-containing protein n=1 Tax=Ascaris lumbricoides TaxID=6252 RepID=A0A0M3IA53_ASCLU
MSSYSSPLPPYVTPGWNDPPANITTERKNSTLITHRHRRPVDPSIQGSVFKAVEPSLQHTNSQPLNANSFAPNSPLMDTNRYHSPMDSNIPSKGDLNTASPTVERHINSQHRAVYDAFTIHNPASQESYDFARINPSVIRENVPSVGPRCGIPFQQNFTSEYCTVPVSHSTTVSAASFPPPIIGPPIESIPSALIYTPPNAVGEINQRPATSPDPASYVAPVKAAGDVSLSGLQLVQFLTKATLRLPPGVTRDGIQLRIGHFNDLVSANAISEGLIKKLNFVVDALDRGLYDEALQFFEQMQSAFIEETKTSWAQGLRLLICELKRPARSGSAGPLRH